MCSTACKEQAALLQNTQCEEKAERRRIARKSSTSTLTKELDVFQWLWKETRTEAYDDSLTLSARLQIIKDKGSGFRAAPRRLKASTAGVAVSSHLRQ